MITAEALKSAFNRHVKSFVGGEVFHQGTIVGVLKTCAGSDGNYRLVLKALTGKTYSKQLSPAEWYALYKFVMPIKPEGEKWHSKHTNEELTRWCNMLVRSTVDVPGQMQFFDHRNGEDFKGYKTVEEDPDGYIAWLYGGGQ